MREIVMDTETTGLDPDKGDKLVEIGAVELINHLPTDKTFHEYINPQRDVPAEAVAVHGLTQEFLSDKPLFEQVADKFLDFIGPDAKLVIHNASFDMKFLNAELAALGRPKLPWSRAIDTLAIAREKFPGAQNSLDALCRRFNIDNSARSLHGALIDSQILAEVYLELIGGRQPDLVLSAPSEQHDQHGQTERQQSRSDARQRPAALASRLSDAERAAHEEFVAKIGENALWHRYVSPSAG